VDPSQHTNLTYVRFDTERQTFEYLYTVC